LWTRDTFVGAIQSRNDQVYDFWWFFENGEGALGCHFTSSYLFTTPQNDLKKNYTSKSWWYWWKRNQSFWITFEHFNFNICTKYRLNEHLSSILSMVVFSQNLYVFIDLFFIGKLHKSSFTSTVAIIKIILREWGIMLITRTSQKNKNYIQTLDVFLVLWRVVSSQIWELAETGRNWRSQVALTWPSNCHVGFFKKI